MTVIQYYITKNITITFLTVTGRNILLYGTYLSAYKSLPFYWYFKCYILLLLVEMNLKFLEWFLSDTDTDSKNGNVVQQLIFTHFPLMWMSNTNSSTIKIAAKKNVFYSSYWYRALALQRSCVTNTFSRLEKIWISFLVFWEWNEEKDSKGKKRMVLRWNLKLNVRL